MKPGVKEKTKKIQLGWLHWNEKAGKFKSARMLKGGGSREVNIAVEATKDDIIAECVTFFFPKRFKCFLRKGYEHGLWLGKLQNRGRQ